METRLVLALFCLCSGVHSLKLPSYIKGCSRNDPNINECAKKSAIEAIPHFIDGDPKYRVPPLEPMIINELSVDRGSSNFGLSFIAKNASLTGFRSVLVRDIRIDLPNEHIEYDIIFPVLNIDAKYNVSGRVLILPITGSGDAKLALKNVTAVIAFDYVKRKLRGDKVYGLPENVKFIFNVGGMTIHLDNLFNGDRFLGDNMNLFLNDNWEELVREVGPSVGEAINQVIQRILSAIFELVPYDEAFPDL